ncbi:hypothetical protein UAW_01121 [Enterococcus haemoperoxidus ATCC BAA-382]|uniref:Uncharacterized protein n=1 Tax=Enterococcus haemoperoxidus ATCC BAA-382 TaxID=1158608 RepID=R2STH1_9ENTE|nr:hypothetical protein UAW_01121 [Enterococcus haemoperoxidus ATCC BAA-382]EOT62292.1 hypothetical protein I583_01292 [Enterococcus haemoperoxidus ATCC BAA-382]
MKLKDKKKKSPHLLRVYLLKDEVIQKSIYLLQQPVYS